MLLSIVIPTKNRQAELSRVLAIMDAYNEDFEIIVHDNSDEKLAMDEKNWQHVRYYWTGQSLSVVQNMDLALSKAIGDYVIAIGDDDCVCYSIFEYTRMLSDKKIESCSFRMCHFLWEDVVEANNHQMKYKRCNHFSQLQKIDSAAEITKICKTSAFSMIKLPKIYHGIVAKTVLDRIFANHNTYCPGPSPDIASSIAICAYSSENYYSDAIVTIAGACAKSAGGMGAKKQHIREVCDVAWLPINIKEMWDKRIPYIWTSETIWMLSMMLALTECKMDRFVSQIDWNMFYCTFYYHHPEQRTRLLLTSTQWKSYWPIAIARLGYRKIKNRLINKQVSVGVKTIEEAVAMVNNMEQDIIK